MTALPFGTEGKNLPLINRHNHKLLEFYQMVRPKLSQPQRKHLLDVAEALLACDSDKTISALNRFIEDATDASALSDFFTYSPWDNFKFRNTLTTTLTNWVLKEIENMLPKKEIRILIPIDDSLVEKHQDSEHFEAAGWYKDHKENCYKYGVQVCHCHIKVGKRSTPCDWKIYLKAKTVRKLNKKRKKEQKALLKFETKQKIALNFIKKLQAIISEVIKIIKENPSFKDIKTEIYVRVDRWYSSKKLIKTCREYGWHVLGALKSNRVFEGKRVSQIARRTRHKRFTRVWVNSTTSSTPYWVHERCGKLKGVAEEAKVFISKRHHRDKRPEFFFSTDTSLSAKEALNMYMEGWVVEVDHLYLKTRLGLGDFRLRSYEGITRYFDAVFFTLAYLYWRRYKEKILIKCEIRKTKQTGEQCKLKTISEVIASHKEEQWTEFLRQFGEEVLKCQSVGKAMENLGIVSPK